MLGDFSNSFTTELATAIVGGLFGLFKTISSVKEGELGIRLRFGKARRDKAGHPVVAHPGFIMLIPFVDTLAKHPVRQQTIRFDRQELMV